MTDGQAEIDYTLLKGREPIQFFDEIVLFEDELADNGMAILTAKVVRRFCSVVADIRRVLM